MENASKALLIAGAILIAILLIAIGMMVFNSASGVIDTAGSNMSDTEKTAFNSQFDIYEGTQSGSNLKTIIQKINTSNSNEANVTIALISGGTSDVSYANGVYKNEAIKNQAQYVIDFQDNDGDGLYEEVSITNR